MKRPAQKVMASLADQLGPEDGIDPRLVRPDCRGRTLRRNTLQLCSQVARTLSGVLAACGDEVLRDLSIVGVVPAAGSGRLLVTVTRAPSATVRPDEVLREHLIRAAGLLRSEVATAVHRKKTPELLFRIT